MESNKGTKAKIYNNATKKISYTRMLIGIKIVKLFRKLLSIVYKRKEKN